MSTSAERAAELRALADQLEATAELEDGLRAAKAAYRDDPSEETRQAHRAAADELRAARSTERGSGLVVGSSTPGSVTIAAGTVAGRVA